ncbi:MAG: glycosyltransferase [Candidatus Scalindua sp.]|nr:glycosyltransferase [Candidatus Scalindua sp.]
MKNSKKKNKVAFLVGTQWFGVLGPCKFLINELVERGYKVYVFGRKDEHYQQFNLGQATMVKLKVKRNYFSFFSDFMDMVKLYSFIRSKSPEFVHSFNPKPSLLCYFPLLFARAPKFFIGVTGLGNTFIKAKRLEGFIRVVFRIALRRASFVFFQNDDDVNLFVNELGLERKKVLKFTSPGVDIQRFKMRDGYKMSGKLKVLLVARLLWQKGVGDFVNVYKKLKEVGLDRYYIFTLVGEQDNEHPDKLLDDDVREIEEIGIEWVPWTDLIEKYYADNDVLLFMSKREGGPRAILEASSTGMPTIGSNCIGVRELIFDGETGYRVETGAIDDIIEKLEYYRANPSLIADHGRAARKMIAEEFSLDNATKAQLQMYDRSAFNA